MHGSHTRGGVELPEGSILLLECVCGSRGYGLHSEESDWDIHGVFMLDPLRAIMPGSPTQVSSGNNDCAYWELRRFLELLEKSNPTALELLGTTKPGNILFRHRLMDHIRLEDFLRKNAAEAFRSFARAQVAKARGANKKFMNPLPRERKTIMDFCVVPVDGAGIPLKRYLSEHGIHAVDCGLAAVDGAGGLHAAYVDSSGGGWARGIVAEDADSFELRYSSVPKGLKPSFYLSYNQNSFKKHCADHREYWHWVSHRNEKRFQDNMANSGGYDAKNMMHAIRPLIMAKELACNNGLNVSRERIDRDLLLSIKRGIFSYEELIDMAERLDSEVAAALPNCSLPDKVMTSSDAIISGMYMKAFNIQAAEGL